MTIHTILGVLTILMVIASIIVFSIRLNPILGAMRNARPVNRFDRVGERLNSILVQVFGHKRLMKNKLAGIIHLFIFSGFVVLMLDIMETLVKVMFPAFSIGTILGAIVNIWVILVLAGVAMAFYHRLVIKPDRFKGSNEGDASFVLILIATIVVGIVIHNSFYTLLAEPVFGVTSAASGHFLGNWLSHLWVAIGWDTVGIASVGYAVGYVMDIGAILLFLAYLPGSKHFHVLSSVPAVFVRDLDRPMGLPTGTMEGSNKAIALKETEAAASLETSDLVANLETNSLAASLEAANLEGASLEADGMAIHSFEDLTWKDTLDLFTCTECGRCQDVCPAYNSGSVLNPKLIITDLRDALNEEIHDPACQSGDRILAGDIISEEALWGCTTCRACEEACPVFIEHVPKIVGLRAALVENGSVESRAQETFKHWHEQGNAYAEDPSVRPAISLQKKALQKTGDFSFKDARKDPVDWLWFLGDVASFDTDPGVLRSIHSISALMKEAGLDVGLLYDGEANSGNDALRMGELGLFEQLAQENLMTMKDASFDRVVTSDPHSFNTLLNDYPKLGFNKPVSHYTEVLLDLVKEGRLEIKNTIDARVTYHDPCYLGRWNGIMAQPRELLELMGAELAEMPRNGVDSLCCGAGGGKFFMNESSSGERPSENRIREAVELEKVTHFVVTCPKDVVMYSAAAVALGYEDRIQVVDIAELLAEAVGLPLLEAQAG